MRLDHLACVIALLLAATALQAGAIRISFMDDESAVLGTSELLLANGCRPETVSALRSAIGRYKLSPPGFKRNKFPAPIMGFYSFSSASTLVEALPHRLCDSEHPFELNCFDAVILLAKDHLQIRPDPDEIAGPFLPAFTWTNNVTYRDVRATARDAFAVSYPSWYVESTKDIMGAVAKEARMCLVAALYCWHALPSPSTDDGLSATLLKVLRRDWGRQGLAFPTNMEVVLCHELPLPAREAWTSHAGLLLHNHGDYVYIEKAGGSGPFVRLDFKDMADLTTWLAAELNSGPGAGADQRYFATFNDKRIETVQLRRK